MSEHFLPMDQVNWHRARLRSGETARIIPAQVWYILKSKVAIRFTNPVGEDCVRYVPPHQLQKRREVNGV